MDRSQSFEKRGRHRHAAIDTPSTLLKAFEEQDAGRQINATSRQTERFRNPATRQSESRAERRNGAGSILGDTQELTPLCWREVFSLARHVEQQRHGRL